MFTAWTKHLKDPESQVDFRKEIYSSRRVLERLSAILKEEEESLDRSEMNINTYDQSNWAERQAHKNGYRSCLYVVQKLIDLDQQENK